MDNDDLDEAHPVDEHRLEALALARGFSVETKYARRGVSWCCWITATGYPPAMYLHGSTKQRAFDRAMDDLQGEVLTRASTKC